MAEPMTCEFGLRVVAPHVRWELVRGEEEQLVEQLEPVVDRESVALDLGGVERIDAAGISALVRLYSAAIKTGHEFRVIRPGRHVSEVLELVGLERLILESDGYALEAREAAA